MILAIYINRRGANYYLLRNEEEVQRFRKEIVEEHWDGDTWTGSPEQVDQYWKDKAECGLEYFFTTSLTYHYEKT